jgi:predicted DNA-binding protein
MAKNIDFAKLQAAKAGAAVTENKTSGTSGFKQKNIGKLPAELETRFNAIKANTGGASYETFIVRALAASLARYESGEAPRAMASINEPSNTKAKNLNRMPAELETRFKKLKESGVFFGSFTSFAQAAINEAISEEESKL